MAFYAVAYKMNWTNAQKRVVLCGERGMNKAEKVAHKHFCLFESLDGYEMIYVHYEDTNGTSTRIL